MYKNIMLQRYLLPLLLIPWNLAGAYKNTHQIKLKKNEHYTIELFSQPTTGYFWYLAKPLKTNAPITIIDKGYTANRPDLFGGGGTQYWEIQAKQQGNAEFTLEYKNADKTNTPPVSRKKYLFNVR